MHKTPVQRDINACRHWLEEEVASIKPDAFLALGATATRALLHRHGAVMRERGHWHEDEAGRRVLVTLHASALLRGDPAQREAGGRPGSKTSPWRRVCCKPPPTSPAEHRRRDAQGQWRYESPMAGTQGDTRIGISGWRYKPWRGRFYPSELPQRQELAFASRMLPTIELNGSFYSLQRPESYQTWHDETPDDFVFAVKGSRYITHMLRLKDVRTPMANFLASGLLALRAKLGPILWQFPPSLRYDPERFEAFFSLLPKNMQEALALAREHDDRLDGRACLGRPGRQRMRHAVEVRHSSFMDPGFIAMLRKHKIALVVADTAGRWPLIEDVTSDFVYVRLHGDKELYASGYGDAVLARWAERVDAWRHGRQVKDARRVSPVPPPRRTRRDVFCYFDNDIKVHAPYDAARLAARLGVANGLGPDGQFVLPPGLVPPGRAAPKSRSRRRE